MSDLNEIKKHVDRLTQLGKSMPERVLGLKSSEGEAMKKKAKKAGTLVGIGVGMSFFGAVIAAVALLYSLAAIILLVNIGLDRLWLSALIVVGGFLIIGCVLVAVGTALAASSAKKLSKTAMGVKQQLKQTGEEMKTEVDVLKKQMAELAGPAKKAAPIAVASFLGYRLLKRAFRKRRENRAILKVIERYEEAQTEE